MSGGYDAESTIKRLRAEVQEAATKLKLMGMRIEGAEHERDKFKTQYEREVAWSHYLLDHRDRLVEFIKRAGHTAGCNSRSTECCPNCGDSTYDHECKLPLECDCGLDAILAPPPSTRTGP